jgi:hypothetical protein
VRHAVVVRRCEEKAKTVNELKLNPLLCCRWVAGVEIISSIPANHALPFYAQSSFITLQML